MDALLHSHVSMLSLMHIRVGVDGEDWIADLMLSTDFTGNSKDSQASLYCLTANISTKGAQHLKYISSSCLKRLSCEAVLFAPQAC